MAEFEADVQAQRAEQLRRHRGAVRGSITSAVLVGPLLVALLWSDAAARPLLAWLGLLAVLVVPRGLVGWAHRRSTPDPSRDRQWLAGYRLSFALHGLAWSAVALGLLPPAGAPDFNVVVFALTAICAGALITTAFDPAAALAFVVPVLLPLLARLFGSGPEAAPATGLMVGLFVAAALLGTLRARRALRDNVRLRRADETSHRALAEKHLLIDQLLATTPLGFWFIDNHGVTTDLNPAMCTLLGRPREQVMGRSVFEFFTGDERRTLDEQLAARAQGRAGGYEIAIVRPDGSRRHCFNNATPLYDTAGARIGSIGIWTDLTERREAELTLRIYEAVANSLTDLVSVVGEDGVYRMVNTAWCHTMGVPREQAVGRHAAQATPGAATAERLAALRDCIATGRRHVLRGPSEDPRYADRQIETTFYPFVAEAAGMRAAVAVTRDISESHRARAALAESAEYLRGTLNATEDAIFASDAADPQQPVRFVNDRMLQMWGIPPALGPRLTPADIMAHALPQFDDPAAEARRVQAIIAEERPHESRLRLRDGRELVRRCIPARIGERMVRVWSFRDVTAEARALEEVRTRDAEQRALLDAFPGHIAVVDQDLTYVFANRPFAEAIGLTPAQVIGQPAQRVLGVEPYAQTVAEAGRARAGERVVTERSYPARADRPRLDLEVTLVAGPRQDDGRQAIYSFGLDITARKRAEEAMAAARDEAQRANLAKSQFLSQMSHELRTPLNAIIGFGQLLASDAALPLGDPHRGYVREILHGGRHLLDLINDVLDLGRIEAGRLVVDAAAVDLRSLVPECLALVQPLAQAHGVQIEAADEDALAASVAADRMRLKQVLLNLLGNAIKYNRPGGHVSLIARRDGEHLRLGVRDTGHGLAAAEIARLFQPFERLGAARTGIEGTGIGLVLSRRLAEAMGGTIEVESEVGVGSTFWVRLPAAQARHTGHGGLTVPGALEPPAGAAGHTVLYIEDNPVNVLLMEAMLARLPGLRVLSAANPVEGLQLARSERPALVLLDIQLPGMDGYEVLRRLRARDETRDIPAIAVTANAMGSEADAALTAGFAAYLTKPLDLETLLGTVQQVLAGAPFGDPA